MKSGDLISRGRGAGHPNRPKARVGLGVGNHAGTDGETNALVGRLVVGEVFGEDTNHAGVVVGLGLADAAVAVAVGVAVGVALGVAVALVVAAVIAAAVIAAAG